MERKKAPARAPRETPGPAPLLVMSKEQRTDPGGGKGSLCFKRKIIGTLKEGKKDGEDEEDDCVWEEGEGVTASADVRGSIHKKTSIMSAGRMLREKEREKESHESMKQK